MKTKNICKQCKHYKLMVKTKEGYIWDVADKTCLFCADYSHRKSHYIKNTSGFKCDAPLYRQNPIEGILKSNT